MAVREKRAWVTVSALVAAGDTAGLEQCMVSLTPAETATTVARLPHAVRQRLLVGLSPASAAGVIQGLPDAQAAAILAAVEPARAALILAEAPSDARADILAKSSGAATEAILAEMPADMAQETRQLLAYAPDTAGGMMQTECLFYSVETVVQEAVADLRTHSPEYTRYGVQYVYVVSPGGRLEGVLRMRDLLFASPTAVLGQLMVREPVAVQATETIDRLLAVFQGHPFLGIPVVDRRGRLLGIVPREKVHEQIGREAQRSLLAVAGIAGGEELRSAPVGRRVAHRLPWLLANVLLNTLAASLIAAHLQVVADAVVLAVFLPILSALGACSGNQAVAVTLREMGLGLVRPSEIGRVLLKELAVGVAIGVLLGVTLAGVAILWQGNPYLGLVAGGALAANTVLSVVLGGVLPLVLRRTRWDPAMATGPLLMTVTNACGFLVVLTLAERLLPYVAGRW